MRLNFKWELQLGVTPRQLWQYVADTNSLNQAAGLSEWKLGYIPDPDGGSRRVGETHHMGWKLRWDERPFEWIEGRQYSVVRNYHNGPVLQFQMSVVLHPAEGGTLLVETIEIEPRWLFMAPAIYLEVEYRSRRSFERVYRRIEQHLKGAAATPFELGMENSVRLERVERMRSRLAGSAGTDFLGHLIKTVTHSPDVELHRLRAFWLADQWGADRMDVLKLCLRAAAEGLLDLSWDVICPSCRGAKVRTSKLHDLRREAHCDACNITYTADFAESVEVTFQPNPAIRPLDVAYYCSGGPMNAPHVVVQQVIKPGETRTIPIRLNPWNYQVRSLKAEGASVLTVEDRADTSEAQIVFGNAGTTPAETTAGPDLTLKLRNESDKEQTVMLERDRGLGQATTASLVSTLSEFRDLFSSEVLAPDTEIRAGTITLMFTDLRASTSMYESIGDTAAYRLVREHFELLRVIVQRHNGTFVKTIGDAVMAAFSEPQRAVAAAFEMHERLAEGNGGRAFSLTLKIGIHAGLCFVVNTNGVLDYFGTTVNIAARIQKEGQGEDVVVTDEVFNDADMRNLVSELGARHEQIDVQIRGLSGTRPAHRLSRST
jgi:class 3 adenylate cyclase